jgi:transcription elongation GreA/GreB family factor
VDGDEMTERKLPKIPRFATEAEEAQWWFDHRDEVCEDIVSAAKNGTLGEGSLARAARKQKEAQKRDSAA